MYLNIKTSLLSDNWLWRPPVNFCRKTTISDYSKIIRTCIYDTVITMVMATIPALPYRLDYVVWTVLSSDNGVILGHTFYCLLPV